MLEYFCFRPAAGQELYLMVRAWKPRSAWVVSSPYTKCLVCIKQLTKMPPLQWLLERMEWFRQGGSGVLL